MGCCVPRCVLDVEVTLLSSECLSQAPSQQVPERTVQSRWPTVRPKKCPVSKPLTVVCPGQNVIPLSSQGSLVLCILSLAPGAILYMTAVSRSQPSLWVS